jgi:hypothetical protein
MSKLVHMIKFSEEVPKCIENWSKIAVNCKADANCLESAAKQLRECLDATFPPSNKVEIESDKINYILSSVFLLSNRLAKATIALAELDDAITTNPRDIDRDEKLKNTINEVISKYF